MKCFRSLAEHCRERYGKKLYKLALSGGMSCPNRDGTVGYGGCIFCSEGGSGEFAAPVCDSVGEQIDRAIAILGKKGRDCDGYIAYFQSYTNTHAPAPYLRKLFSQTVADDRVAVLSVATRPDCLSDEVLAVLGEMARIKPLWVELGLQTVHESSAEYIRRGYALPVFERAVKALHAVGAEVIVHVIIGLPNESPEMIRQTAAYVGRSGADGIKLQLLHVLSGTDLCKEYEKGVFRTLEIEEYCALLADCIRVLPPNMTVHRITGDGDKRLLVAPLWSADKKRSLQYINDYLEKHRVRQGEDLSP